MKIVMIALLSLWLLGCQAMMYGTSSDFEELRIGMSKSEVIDVLGSPTAVHADGDRGEEYLVYKKMKHAISQWPRTYTVTLRDNRVVKWGEQYNEQNINNF